MTRKEDGREIPSIEDCVNRETLELEQHVNKSKERLITSTRNSHKKLTKIPKSCKGKLEEKLHYDYDKQQTKDIPHEMTKI